MPATPIQMAPVKMAGTTGGSAFGRQMASQAGEQPHAAIAHGNGRGLAAYREMPVRMALRVPPNPG
jgi:hypothetical protein